MAESARPSRRSNLAKPKGSRRKESSSRRKGAAEADRPYRPWPQLLFGSKAKKSLSLAAAAAAAAAAVVAIALAAGDDAEEDEDKGVAEAEGEKGEAVAPTTPFTPAAEVAAVSPRCL